MDDSVYNLLKLEYLSPSLIRYYETLEKIVEPGEKQFINMTQQT